RRILGRHAGEERAGGARDLGDLPERPAPGPAEGSERPGVSEANELVLAERAPPREIVRTGEGRPPLLGFDSLSGRLFQALDEPQAEPHRPLVPAALPAGSRDVDRPHLRAVPLRVLHER